jgi:hypothetical protein
LAANTAFKTDKNKKAGTNKEGEVRAIVMKQEIRRGFRMSYDKRSLERKEE